MKIAESVEEWNSN